jgi:hypothetical protein
MNQDTIKITSEDKFIWKVVTLAEAKAIIRKDIFTLHALYDDDSESMIADEAELVDYVKRGVEIGIEVGFVNYKEEQELRSLIKSHDFDFEMSNGAIYKRGNMQRKAIMKLSKHVEQTDFVRWWNRSAPPHLNKPHPNSLLHQN